MSNPNSAPGSERRNEFTQEEIAHFHEVFDIFDRNGDGHITAQELGSVMRSLDQNPSQAELNEMISRIDKDRNGTIEFNEFLDMVKQQILEGEKEEDIIDAFRVFDKDGNGTITTADLSHIMKMTGDELPQEEIDRMIAQADPDKDGKIDYAEFVHRMMNGRK